MTFWRRIRNTLELTKIPYNPEHYDTSNVSLRLLNVYNIHLLLFWVNFDDFSVNHRVISNTFYCY